MKLWIDDERDPPDTNWVVARTVSEAVRLLARQRFNEISIDHDDGHDSFEPVAYFIGEKYYTSKPADGFFGQEMPANMIVARPSWYPKITIHSANPLGAKKIWNILRDYGILSEYTPYTIY